MLKALENVGNLIWVRSVNDIVPLLWMLLNLAQDDSENSGTGFLEMLWGSN